MNYHLFEGVGSVKDHIDQTGCHRQLIIPCFVQNGFQAVGKLTNLVQVQETCHPFHGVKRSEDNIDILFVFGILFQVQDIYFDLIDIFEALDNEVPEQ